MHCAVDGSYDPGDSSNSITADLSYTVSLSGGGRGRGDDGSISTSAPARVYQLASSSSSTSKYSEGDRSSSAMDSSSGGIPSSWDSVFAYCPQIPTILDGSVRSNILMGHELVPSRYEDVLMGCGLRQDMMVCMVW
jgi:hypothetical protein